MSLTKSAISANSSQALNSASTLSPQARKRLAIEAVAGVATITKLANDADTSRKFIYAQKQKAETALDKAFSEEATEDKVLFYIPVTTKWLTQAVLALIFICRGSYQGVKKLFRDLLDCEISKGTVHNIVYEHLEKAKKINRQQDLSQVKKGLHDEIYQAGDPVLVGCCADSTYCYLLKLVETCDANSWGVHLLDLNEKQGLTPDFTVIDGGQCARKGQKDAWPEIPARGDTFHALKPFLEMISYLDNRAMDTLKAVEDLQHKIKHPRGKWKGKQEGLCQKLIGAEEASKKAVLLVDELTTLYRWLKNDILSLVGPSYADRQELLRFVVEQLGLREALCRYKMEPVRRYLENHSGNLLEFVPTMEMFFYEIAQEFKVPLLDVLAVYQLKGLPSSSQKRCEREAVLKTQLGPKFYWIESLVDKVLEDTVRANSLVENLNSRLRTYFTLRRELGNEYLEFLQFFLNHRRFMRSECKERVGKSPRELLTGEKHKHWLEMLGFELFKQAA